MDRKGAARGQSRLRGDLEMNVKRPITPEITIADQPTEADLAALREEGYGGVVNLRNDGEPDQPLGTVTEGEQVRALGLDYLHYGVGGAPLTEPGVDSVCTFLERHAATKVLVHCRKGSRAAALVLLYLAQRQGWDPDEALEKGRAMGLEVEGGLRILVENYLHARHDRT
jgi:uncharacterized protein (TIGR01244 family)